MGMLSTCPIGFQATDVDLEIADMKVDSTLSTLEAMRDEETSGAFNSAYLKAADTMRKVGIEEPDEISKENIRKNVCKNLYSVANIRLKNYKETTINIVSNICHLK